MQYTAWLCQHISEDISCKMIVCFSLSINTARKKERRKADVSFFCFLDARDEGYLMERKEKPCFITCTKTEYSSCHHSMSAFREETE